MRTLPIDSSLSLESQLERLSLEANFVTDLADSFREVIPGLAAKLVDATTHFKSNLFDKPRVKEIRGAYDKVKPVLRHADFLNYGNMLVSVPEGFKGDLASYAKLLTRLSPVIYKEANGFISEYNFALSDFLTNADVKHSNNSHDVIYKKVKATREDGLRALSPYFAVNSTSSKAKLSSIIGRFADLEALSESAVALEKTQSVSNLQDIADGVAKAITLLNLIKTRLEDDSIDVVGGISAASISNGAYELAKYVEFISIFRFKCDQTSASVENIINTVYERITEH